MRYGSRKFIMANLHLLFCVGCPILFKHLGIGDDITKIVILSSLGSHLYNFSNVLDSRISSGDNFVRGQADDK
jgi:hypothetical protein